jgi:hypothetical protein
MSSRSSNSISSTTSIAAPAGCSPIGPIAAPSRAIAAASPTRSRPTRSCSASCRTAGSCPPDLPRAVFLQQLADVLQNGDWQKILTDSTPDAERRFDDALGKITGNHPALKIRIGEVRSLGVLARDMTMAGIAAFTEVKGLTVTINVYTEFAGAQTFKTLQRQARELTRKLLADNGNLS